LANRRQFKEAVPHLKNAVDQAPHDFENQLLLAQTLVGAGDDYDSLTHFEQAAKLDPSNEFAVIDGAATLVRLNQYHRAVSVLDAGLERMPDSGLIALGLARLLAACPESDVRDGERALDLATRIFEAVSTPRHAQVVAQALAELGRCDEAATWQQSIVDAAVEAGATEALPALRADLEMYLAGPPCRIPVTR
jgi:serine/threonine-protein kinase